MGRKAESSTLQLLCASCDVSEFIGKSGTLRLKKSFLSFDNEIDDVIELS